jgi:integrase/recombinase XerD
LFEEGLITKRNSAIFTLCLFMEYRLSNTLALLTTDVRNNTITFRQSTTKGKLKTRQVAITPAFGKILPPYQPPSHGALFLGMHGRGHLTRFMAAKLLKEACQRIGVEGVSTHSFRRTALTQMHNAGIP